MIATTSTSTAAIFAFSSILISMVWLFAFCMVMLTIFVVAGYPLSIFCRAIMKFIKGNPHD